MGKVSKDLSSGVIVKSHPVKKEKKKNTYVTCFWLFSHELLIAADETERMLLWSNNSTQAPSTNYQKKFDELS